MVHVFKIFTIGSLLCSDETRLKKKQLDSLNPNKNYKPKLNTVATQGYIIVMLTLKPNDSFKLKAYGFIGLRACSCWKKLSRLARKHLDKFTSQISPSCENSMKR